MAGQPLWVKLFYLIRTGHVQEALAVAFHFQQAIKNCEATWPPVRTSPLPEQTHYLFSPLLKCPSHPSPHLP